ncbi:MAG: tRNA lysidine(34) synthetase TilS [Betaproteobacteria bacterium RIFCSPLOWO2_02_FULL_65_24]|nr:MAG: tRNA lysidine(34) synthetase TilS [Betaproteobacteria bacterium RIFCSPLOWO2_02_FULL_65_24]OGA79803.1 MAG: tRNA lysidine(34) synthetase TilS [Betaproteobacteria bacterium RIFCSPLOWO2_12_FULL_66_14]
MASSGKSTSSDLPARVARELGGALFPAAHVVLGLSGGVDSASLLVILSELAERMQFSLRAVHVHHGLSANADCWAAFCESLCDRLGIRLAVERVDIAPYRSLGLEGAARAARYEAFAKHDSDFLVLAQHRDDQAETLLLQLLRGAGPAGLAGMPRLGRSAQLMFPRRGVLRPLLGTSRAEIEAFARERGLEWVVDESNADTTLDRNFLRLRVLPLIEERYPHARHAIARSAAYVKEAADVLEAVGREDVASAWSEASLDLSRVRALGHARAKNALRVLCRDAGCPVPGGARLEQVWMQATTAREDACPRVDLDGWAFRRYRGRLFLDRIRSGDVRDAFPVHWQGDNALPLLALGGTLKFKPEEGRGLSVEKLHSAPVTIRLRRGGERLHLDPRRPHRTLKNLFQERAVPPWRRDTIPLVYCGDALVAVPGIGEACEWRSQPGERGLIVSWEPA